MRLLSAIAVSVFLFAANANAATYYVATTGNDAANGSSSAPFRTLKQATRVVRPGDVVNVRGGVYYETTHAYQVKGTAAAPIVIRSMPGEQAILDGSKLTGDTPIINLNENEYVDFSGFEVRNGPYIGVMVWHGRNVRVFDNHVHHVQRYGIYAGGETTPASYDITVSGNEVHDAALENRYHTSNEGWPGAVVISRTERATITGNKIFNNDGEGLIWGRSSYGTVRNNEIFDNFSINLYVNNARFGTIDRNLVYSTGNTRYYRDGKPAAGLAVANEIMSGVAGSSDNVFTNNIVVGTRWGFYYGAFLAGGGLLNTKVLHNTFYGTTDEIVRVENDAHSNSLVANNIFHQTGSIAPKYSGAGAGAVTYRNNLWYGGTSGVAAGTADLYADPLFINAGGRSSNDYRLRPLSPAVHTALDLTDVTTDFFGQARTPASDIGAHEESTSLGSGAPVTPAILAPASVSATVSNGRVTVAWAAAQGAVRYDVYRNGRFFDTVDTNALVDDTVAASATYVYEVSSRDLLGNESARSMAATITTPAAKQVLQAPGALVGVAASTRVDLSWGAVTGAAGYIVYRNGAAIAQTQSASYTDHAVTGATTYAYRVVAVAADGTRGNASETISVTTTTPGRRRSVR